MLYEYHCRKCGKSSDLPFPMGKAQPTVQCPACKGVASRTYGGASFILKGGGWPSKKLKFNAEQTRKNTEAGQRMRGNKPPVRRVATDYGNGDVREVRA